jgi:transcriptional regulator with XRE-family HTH domain
MGRYRLGDTVRMARKSLGITQEQLCEEICSVETLSRIENGSQTPTRDTYELLMERMGRIRSRAYSMLSVSDLKVLEKMKLFEDYIKRYDFIRADYILDEIRASIGGSTLDKQFLYRAESLVNYHLNRISAEDYYKGFLKAIKLTIPRFTSVSLSKWPLSFNEAMLLINISIAHAEAKDYKKAIKLIKEVYTAMKQSYMEEEQRAILMVTIVANLSKWYGLVNRYNKAIEVIREGLNICKSYKLGNVLPNLLYGLAWNLEQMIDTGVLSPAVMKECYSYLKQAYYIASAMQLSVIERHIAEHIESKYSDISNLLY